MNKNHKDSNSDKLIRIKEAMHVLRVSPQQFYVWKKQGKFKIKRNKNNKRCIHNSELKQLAYSDFVRAASFETFLNNMKRRKHDEFSCKNILYKKRIKVNIKRYRSYVKTLQQVHTNYNNRIDLFQTELALFAAYMLFARIISLLNMACMCIEEYYWYATALLRPIDETIDLAEYFIISENSNTGKKHLKTWFRENKSPSHSICRKSNSKFMGTFLGKGISEVHEESMSDLYRVKSKYIHPTFNEILYVHFNPEVKNRKIVAMGFDYDHCSNLRELYELSVFFQSSIWTAVQGFLFCFSGNMPLKEQDTNQLNILDRKFNHESNNF